MTHNELKELSC